MIPVWRHLSSLKKACEFWAWTPGFTLTRRSLRPSERRLFEPAKGFQKISKEFKNQLLQCLESSLTQNIWQHILVWTSSPWEQTARARCWKKRSSNVSMRLAAVGSSTVGVIALLQSERDCSASVRAEEIGNLCSPTETRRPDWHFPENWLLE